MAGATKGEESLRIAAAPEHIYALVSDVTRMGDWSPECRRCEWLDGATGPIEGARFRGHNRVGPIRWSMTAKVVAAEPPREFAFTTVDGERESTRWRYHLAPAGEGTVVTESYEFVWAPLFYRVADIIMGRDRQLHAGMRKTLARLKAVAETAG